jgi:Flp pilus assembly protein TadG
MEPATTFSSEIRLEPEHSPAGVLRKLTQCRSGSSAVEFALIGPPFLALLYALLQTALVFFAQQTLQTATMQAARLIMTNQAQAANLTAAQFQQDVCNNTGGLFNCANLVVNVQTPASFSSVTMFNPVSGGNFSSSGTTYSLGNPGDIEVVQVFYQWPVYPGPLGFSLSDTNSNTNVLTATVAFRNEP